MPTSSLLPFSLSSIFTVSSSIIIDAPRDKVWSILLDFGSYEEWNPFVRNQTIVDKFGNALPNQTPWEGRHLLIYPIHLPPTMSKPGPFQKQSSFEIITTLDHENYRTAWRNISFPRILFSAERRQALNALKDGKTEYESTEICGGILAYIIKYIIKEKLALGFNAQAEGLKRRAEKK